MKVVLNSAAAVTVIAAATAAAAASHRLFYCTNKTKQKITKRNLMLKMLETNAG